MALINLSSSLCLANLLLLATCQVLLSLNVKSPSDPKNSQNSNGFDETAPSMCLRRTRAHPSYLLPIDVERIRNGQKSAANCTQDSHCMMDPKILKHWNSDHYHTTPSDVSHTG